MPLSFVPDGPDPLSASIWLIKGRMKPEPSVREPECQNREGPRSECLGPEPHDHENVLPLDKQIPFKNSHFYFFSAYGYFVCMYVCVPSLYLVRHSGTRVTDGCELPCG